MRTTLASRRLGHVFAPVWRAQGGALFGFDAIPRLMNGTAWHEAAAIARETGDLAELAELSLLSALRASWELPGSLVVRLDPAEDFSCQLPQDTLLRRSQAIVADVHLSSDEPAAYRHTLGALRREGVAIAVSGRDLPSLIRVLAEIRPDVVRLGAPQWNQADVEAFAGSVHAAGALLLCDGVTEPGQLDDLQRQGCDLVAGGHVGRPAPADAWTPARIGLSWPSERSR